MIQHLGRPMENCIQCKNSEADKTEEELDTTALNLQLSDILMQVHKLEETVTRLRGIVGCSYKKECSRTSLKTVNCAEDMSKDQRIRDVADQTT